MTQDMTIGFIDVHKPIYGELTENGIEKKESEFYEFVVRECPKLDYNICERGENESSFNINNMGFGFFWGRIANELSIMIQMDNHSAIIASEEFERFDLEDLFTVPFFCMCDPFMIQLKPLLSKILELPDDIYYEELIPEDNIFFEDLIRWLKFWSVRAIELYDEDAYIEFT